MPLLPDALEETMLFRSRPLRAYGPRCMHCARPLRNPLGRLRFCRRCGRSQMGYA